MTPGDLALLLSVLGATCMTAALLGLRSGDATRDVGLMLGAGGCMLAAAALTFVS